jgi:hypothetical protein
MRVLGLALAGVLAITTPIAAHANGPGSNIRSANAGPAPRIAAALETEPPSFRLGLI